MLTFILLIITVLFFVFTFFKRTLQKMLPFSFCALCTSVLLTWIGLLISSFVGGPSDIQLLAILMGESITGIMYKLTLQQPLQPKNSALSLFILLLGTTLAYAVLTLTFPASTLFILIPLFFVSLLFSLPKKRSSSATTKTLREKLEHCCS
mgnify:FL=1